MGSDMNLAQSIKNVHKSVSHKWCDPEIETAISIIVEKFGRDYFEEDSIEFDIYFKDSFGQYDTRPRDNSDLTEKQQLFAYKEAAKNLEPLCKKLSKFGFKCKVIARVSKTADSSRKQVLHTPWIQVSV